MRWRKDNMLATGDSARNDDLTIEKLIVLPVASVLSIAGAIGTLKRKKWGVGLLGAMTFLHCCLVMVFVVGDSFGKCWHSFNVTS